MKKYGVFVYCSNDKGKHYHSYHEMTNMIDVARFLITNKPPRGYQIVKIEIGEAEQLEMDLFEKVREE